MTLPRRLTNLFSQGILGMLPRTNKELSKGTSEQRKKPPKTSQKGIPETIQEPGSRPIPVDLKKKKKMLTGTLVRLAKGTPKGLPEKLREHLRLLEDASKVLRRGVLEAKTQKA